MIGSYPNLGSTVPPTVVDMSGRFYARVITGYYRVHRTLQYAP